MPENTVCLAVYFIRSGSTSFLSPCRRRCMLMLMPVYTNAVLAMWANSLSLVALLTIHGMCYKGLITETDFVLRATKQCLWTT
ncbi:hypothetical protein BJ165DRAFT_1435683 [Panaeolus papilionaceus]|nr:hypothetical protein BJ165DRAFT_1435683 [Panaeolus papilionaceus]